MSSIARLVRDNSMSIMFALLFVATILGEAITGYHEANQQLAAQGRTAMGVGSWLTSGGFLNAMAVNWQAAILQLATLVLAGALLYQRGASHSRDPDKEKRESAQDKRRDRDEERRFPWIRRHSLSLALLVCFLFAFTAHLFVGAAAYNEQRTLMGQAPLTTKAYAASAQFWFENFQTWEAEFAVILIFVVLTIFLREERSAESKPLGASGAATGETND
jgi:quinol-cytochrome oxidoreductase complex cytochrome b subunit